MAKNRMSAISDYEVRVRAYRIWEQKGRPEGCAEDNWREALAQLEAERLSSFKGPPRAAVADPPARAKPAAENPPSDKAA